MLVTKFNREMIDRNISLFQYEFFFYQYLLKFFEGFKNIYNNIDECR